MQRFVSVLGLSVLAYAASANAAVLYDSNGFEASAGFVSGGFLTSQTGGTPASTFAGTVQSPQATVGSYFGGSNGNLQFVALTAGATGGTGLINAGGDESGAFYPTTFSNNPYQAAGQQIAIRWTMTTSSPTATSGRPFFGISATSDTTGTEIARFGVDNSTGALVGAGNTSFGGLTATAGVALQYELLLDYAAQTYSVYTATADGVSPFVLRGSGAFETAATTFADADLSTFSLDGASYAGMAIFDNYSVQTVPEPATIAIGGLALGLLGRRRAR